MLKLLVLSVFISASLAALEPIAMPGGQLPHYRVNPMGMSDTSFLVPELTANPTKVASTSGTFSSLNAQANDIVVIDEGTTITINSATVTVKAIGVKGTLIFDPNTNIDLNIETLFVYDTGRVEIKPTSSVKHTITFDGSLDTTADPGQWGLGFVTIGGSVEIMGSYVTPYARLTRAVAGENYITVESSPNNWGQGDEIVLAGGDSSAGSTDLGDLAYSPRFERIAITSVDGNRINLASSLQYSYNKSTLTINGNDYTRDSVYGMAAHMTRNVLFQTASANYDDQSKRAHFVVQLNTTAIVQYTAFHEMGRSTAELLDDTSRNSDRTVAHVGTNQRGRYALHAHQLRFGFDFTGNAIYSPRGNQRWGITMHDTLGNMQQNVVVFHGGAAIATELATESGTMTENLVVGVGGGTGLLDPTGGRQGAKYDFGHGGMGYWISGNKMELSNNIADGYFQASSLAVYLFWYGRGAAAPIVHDDDMYPDVGGSPLAGKKIQLWEPITTFNGFTNYAFTKMAVSVGEAAGVVPYVFDGITSYHGAIKVHGHGGYISFKNFKLYGEGSYTAVNTQYYDQTLTRGVFSDLNYVVSLEDGLISGFSDSFGWSYHTKVENVQFNNVHTMGELLSETQIPSEARLLTYMNQATFVIPPLPETYDQPPTYTTADPEIMMEITYPNYADTIPVQDTVTVYVAITGSKTVSKVEFYLDDVLVNTKTSSPYSIDLEGPLSYAKHVLKIVATCDDGTQVINPQHVFYTVPSRDTAFHKGWNIGGPQATYKGNTFDAAENPSGDYAGDESKYNINDSAPTDDAELQVLLDTSANLPGGEGAFMTVNLDGIENGVYHMYSHWVVAEPLSTSLTLIVQDEAVSVTPAAEKWNNYLYKGPVVLYINNNEQLTISATMRNNGVRLSLCAAELHRVLDPAPGTQPVPIQLTPNGQVLTPGNNSPGTSTPGNNTPGNKTPNSKTSGSATSVPLLVVQLLVFVAALFWPL